MPKMSAFIEELQNQLSLYGDHDVIMSDDTDPTVSFDEEIEETGPVFVIE
jgi:hypothetical protein